MRIIYTSAPGELWLVGNPCYGTIEGRRADRRAGLWLVGNPCYGTIGLVNVRAWSVLWLVGNPCYGTMRSVGRALAL